MLSKRMPNFSMKITDILFEEREKGLVSRTEPWAPLPVLPFRLVYIYGFMHYMDYLLQMDVENIISLISTLLNLDPGQGVIAGASVFGIGALCYYGLGMSSESVGTSISDRAIMWPNYVRERIRDTYMYFGGSLAFTAATAMSAFRSPAVMNLMMRNSWVGVPFS